ncbi:MAG TPA: replication protein [Syntrophorhabdaceae bacterium]|nr:replication protein [Syntrophorhabdaceae bacterium]
MANPQLNDGFLRIPNDIFRSLVKLRIPGEARQVFDCVIDKTYGWNDTSALISLTDFQDATGLSKVHVLRGLNNLLVMNLIIITQKGNDSLRKKPTSKKEYAINGDSETWKPLPKKVTVITQKGNGGTAKLSRDNNSRQAPKGASKDNKDSLKTCTKTFPSEADAYRLSAVLFDEILKQNSNSKLHVLTDRKREQQIQLWALDIDKLIRLDRQEAALIEKVIRFVTADDFEKGNVLSGAKLRDRWDQLVLKALRNKKSVDSEKSEPAPTSSQKKIACYKDRDGNLRRVDNGAIVERDNNAASPDPINQQGVAGVRAVVLSVVGTMTE